MKITNRRFLVADFETSTQAWLERDNGWTRVWLWGLYDIYADKFEYGIDLDSFMKRVLIKDKEGNPIIYFHNLKFDGSYLVWWLFAHGYTYNEELEAENSFRTCISDMGQWYFVEVCIYKHKKSKYVIRFQDSLKKIPLPVRDIPKAFGFEDILKKGELDYDTYRPVGHEPTAEELEYLRPDCVIVAQALKKLEEQGFTKMTNSGDAFYSWKLSLLSKKAKEKHVKPEHNYRSYFPLLDLSTDDFIRRAYRGGWTYVNPKYAGLIINKPVEVWDINSMYPDKMRNKYLPVGEPTYFKGKPHPNKYQCYIVRIMICFDIKKDHLPCIQLKNSFMFNPTDYIESSMNQEIEMVVTNIDLSLIFAQYNVHKITYIDGYYFRKYKGFFNDHIDTQMAIKERATGGERYVAKLRMNTVYGKMATSPRKKSKIPFLDNDVVKFVYSDEKIEDPEYTAMSVFITSWGRNDIIRDAQKNYYRFIYCDTDSLHMLKNEDGSEPNLPIHQTHLGYYKKEHDVIKSTFLRSKTYIEQYTNGDVEIKCAGASPEVKKGMNFENFMVGMTFEGKLAPKQVKGGCVLVKTTFTIK